MQNKPTRKQLRAQARQILKENGYNSDGSPKGSMSSSQYFFEKNIIGTPMGNRMR